MTTGALTQNLLADPSAAASAELKFGFRGGVIFVALSVATLSRHRPRPPRRPTCAADVRRRRFRRAASSDSHSGRLVQPAAFLFAFVGAREVDLERPADAALLLVFGVGLLIVDALHHSVHHPCLWY